MTLSIEQISAAMFSAAGERRKVALILVTVLSVALAGCSYVNPYVKRDVVATTAEPNDIMPRSKEALSKLDQWLKEVENAHNQAAYTRRGLNLFTFGLVSGAGIAALTSKSTNAVRNLALASGVAYTGTTLFLPTEQLTLYNSASTALLCIKSRASGLRASVVAQRSQLAMELPTQFKEATLAPAGCVPDSATQAALSSAEAARQLAMTAALQTAGTDQAVAHKVDEAGQNVINTLNSQLDLLSPSADAILASAKSSVAIANGLIAAPPSKPAAAGAPAPAGSCTLSSGPVVEKLREQLHQLQTDYESVQAAFARQLNAVASLDTACTLATLQLAPVTLSQSEVTLSKDMNFNIVVSGGTGNYFWTSVGEALPADLVVNMAPGGTLMLIAKSTLAASKTYSLSIRDSSAVPKAVTLKIVTK